MFTVIQKNLVIVGDNIITAESFCRFFKTSGRGSSNACKKLALNVMKNRGPALQIGGKITSAALNRSLKAAFSTIPDVICF